MIRSSLVLFYVLLLSACSSSSSNDSRAEEDENSVKELIGTTWQSAECDILHGWYTKYSIAFEENQLVYHYKQCSEYSETLSIQSRPVTYGEQVTMESGVQATKLIVNTQFFPADEYSYYKYDVIDYIYFDSETVYTASKDLRDCVNSVELISNGVRSVINCVEWSQKLNFEFPFYKEI